MFASLGVRRRAGKLLGGQGRVNTVAGGPWLENIGAEEAILAGRATGVQVARALSRPTTVAKATRRPPTTIPTVALSSVGATAATRPAPCDNSST